MVLPLTTKTMTLGERNNNPLNIRKVPGVRWRGELPSIQGGAGGGSFVRFESIEWGLRAAYCILRTYRNKYKAVCIEDIITRWAPPTENDTRRYICDCCRLTGFGGKERLAEKDWPQLVKAMARIECGAILSEEIIEQGYNLFKKMKK